MWKILLLSFLLLFFTIQMIFSYFGHMNKLSKLRPEELGRLFPKVYIEVNTERIKPIPWWWSYVPFLHGNIASSLAPISPYVYLPKDMYKNILGNNPNPENIAVLHHEFTHFERYKNVSWWEAFGYIYSRKVRINEELFSISNEMRYRVKNNLEYNTNRKAKHFSGPVYLWASNYKDAYEVLENLWTQSHKQDKR